MLEWDACLCSCISSSKHEPFVIKNGRDSSHMRLSPPVGIRGVRAGAATLTRAFPLLWGGHSSHGDAALLLSPSEREPAPPTPQQKHHGTSHVPSTAWWMAAGRNPPPPNYTYLLMCLRNNVLHLGLSRCQAVWPGGDVLNSILIIEIFATPVMPFCWLGSFRQMASITQVQLESGGCGVEMEDVGLCKNLIYYTSVCGN